MNNSLTQLSHEAYKDQLEQTPQTGKRIALVALCLGYFMVILDTTIVNVALPRIQQELGATVTGLQWVIDGYNLVFASFLLTAGALGDRLGSKRVFMGGLGLFVIASATCGTASTLWVLQAARVVQGVGAALLVPASLALLSHTFTEQRERARAIGIWGGIAGVGALAGTVLGGVLVNILGWRSIFWVNVPIGMAGLLLTIRYVNASPRLRQRGIDLPAQFTGIIALATLTFVLIQGNAWGWLTWLILMAFGIFVLATIAFLIIERHSQSPMLPLRLFAEPTFSAANTVGLLLNLGFYGQLFVITFFFQQIQGYSPALTGLAILPEAGMAMIASTASGRVGAHTGSRLPMTLGLLLGCVGFLTMMLVDKTTNYLFICGMLIAIGFGTAFTMPAMTTAVIDHAPKTRSGIAAAVLNTSRQVGSVLGVALLGSFIERKSTFIAGMHIAMLIAGVAFLTGCILTLTFVRGTRSID